MFMTDSQKPELSIIIVNYNTKQLTCNCINSIKEKTKDLRYEIIVVDNASHDDSVSFLKQNFSDLIILESPENIGFGRANNLAADVAHADTLFLLNSDTIIVDNSIKVLYDYLQEHPKTGVCGGLLLNEDGSIGHSSSPQLTLTHYLRSYLPACFHKIPIEERVSNVTEVGYICGADMMVRKNVFEEAGRFDSDFFLYYEESELSYRIKKKDYRIQLVPLARIIHLGGSSGTAKEELSEFILQEQWYSRFLYFRKVYSSRHPYYLYVLHLLIGNAKIICSPARREVWKNRLRHMRKAFKKYKEYACLKKSGGCMTELIPVVNAHERSME